MAEEKKSKAVIYVVIAVIAIVIIFVIAKNSNQPNNNQTSLNSDNQIACAKQAKILFDSVVEHYINLTNPSYKKQQQWSYTNHFNSKEGKCFMVVTDVDYVFSEKLALLYDVYDNKQLASYSKVSDVSNPSKPPIEVCSITGGGDCLTNNIFAEKMESTTY